MMTRMDTQDETRSLTDAFAVFNRSAERLQNAYGGLQKRVAQIDAELAEANHRLAEKVDQLDNLTGYLNSILASMHSGLIAVDLQCRITSLNPAAESLLGVSGSEVLGKPCEAVMRHNDGTSLLLRTVLETQCAGQDGERVVKLNDGSVRVFSSSVSQLRDPQGTVKGAVEIFRDLTELHQLRERLGRARTLSALGEMAASMAHEIRNPLNAIEGFAALLERGFEDGDRRKGFASNIIKASRSLNRSVTNMLLLGRAPRLNAQPVRISQVIGSALDFVREELRQNGASLIEIREKYDPGAEEAMVDPDQLKQVLLNLMLNAIQSMAEGGKLSVFTRACAMGAAGVDGSRRIDASPATAVEIGIQDTRPGIPAGLQDRIFGPFFTTKANGSGLGLATARQIVELHGGRLSVCSKPDEGTTFFVNLPAVGTEMLKN